MIDAPARHFIVRGRVQGVFFRVNTRGQARALGLRGWVRNLPDRSVEVWAEGPVAGLDRLQAWLRVGSPQSRVDEVVAADVVSKGDFSGFEIS